MGNVLNMPVLQWGFNRKLLKRVQACGYCVSASVWGKFNVSQLSVARPHQGGILTDEFN